MTKVGSIIDGPIVVGFESCKVKVNKFFFFFGISIKAKANMIIRLSNVVCFDFARSLSVSGLYVASHYVFARRK